MKASRELTSNITELATDEIELGRNRPVDEVYPIVHNDRIRIKVRDKGGPRRKPARLSGSLQVVLVKLPDQDVDVAPVRAEINGW